MTKINYKRKRIFALEEGKPAYSIRLVLSGLESFVNDLNNCVKDIESIKQNLHIYGELERFPPYWITYEKGGKEESNEFHKISPLGGIETEQDSYSVLPKKIVKIPLDNIQQRYFSNKKLYKFTDEDEGKEYCLHLHDKKIKIIRKPKLS